MKDKCTWYCSKPYGKKCESQCGNCKTIERNLNDLEKKYGKTKRK